MCSHSDRRTRQINNMMNLHVPSLFFFFFVLKSQENLEALVELRVMVELNCLGLCKQRVHSIGVK